MASPASRRLVLSADIGGTSTRIALIEVPSLKIARRDERPTQEMKEFSTFAKAFLGEEKVVGVAVGAAGPVEGGKGKRIIRLINAGLAVEEAKLRTLATRTLLVNDFTALAASLETEVKTRRVRKGRPDEAAPRILIGPGTGLGSCLVLGDGTVVPGEGGHADLPLRTPEEYAIAAFIRAEEGLRQDDPVWYEHLLSGPGLVRLHRYARAARYPEGQELKSAEAVATGPDAACVAARTLFLRFLARRARNMALDSLALGGLILAGGILGRNPEMIGGAFLAEFDRHPHPRYKELLSQIPVTLLLDPDAGLRGAARAFVRSKE